MLRFSGHHGHHQVSRRDLMRLSAAGVLGSGMSGWMEVLAAQAAGQPERKRSCILLWMNGGPSHLDTFDLKPGHANGGPFQEIATDVSGIRISEHLPQVAQRMSELAILRSMTSKEADHGRASYLVRTGRPPEAALQYPTLGSMISKELGNDMAALPNFVSIAPYRSTNLAAYNSGFLGPRYAPFIVGDVTPVMAQQQDPAGYQRALRIADLQAATPHGPQRDSRRWELLGSIEQGFFASRPDVPVQSHLTAYERAARLMDSSAANAFTFDDEPPALRDAYGRNLFGHGCLLARRLVERGVPFVEVSLGGVSSGGMGWDAHVNNFETVKRLCGVLDPAWGTLLRDLKDRGLLETTLVVWMGEFGRTPKINGAAGRDHYPLTWSAVLGGGGIQGGQVVGATSSDGAEVKDQPCTVPELLATVCQALGLDPHKTNPSTVGRPIHLVDYEAHPIEGIVP
jgi:hypothetical protein